MAKSLLLLIFITMGACADKTHNRNIYSTANLDEFKKSILSGQSYLLMQEDDSLGEWGGNKVFIKIKNLNDSEEIIVDLKKVRASYEPPPPPNSDSSDLYYNNLIILESKSVPVDEDEIEMALKAILELVEHKTNDSNIGKICSGWGFRNMIVNSDSTFVISDCQSIQWGNFQKLWKSVNFK